MRAPAAPAPSPAKEGPRRGPDRPPAEAAVEPAPRVPLLRRAAATAPAPVVGSRAEWTVTDDDAEPAAGEERRTEFFGRLRLALDGMVAEETHGTLWQGRRCPWVDYWIQRFERRPLTDLRRALAWFMRGQPPPADATGARAAVVAGARAAMREWLQSGRMPALPPGLEAPALSTPVMRRFAEDAGAPAEDATAPAHDTAALLERLGPGQALDAGARARFEGTLGSSLAGVRVHTDATAAALAGSLQARAFSLGPHVAFAAGQFRPGTFRGDALLAHELAHVTQPASLGHQAAERDANRAAARALGAAVPRAPAQPGGLALRRCGTGGDVADDTALADVDAETLAARLAADAADAADALAVVDQEVALQAAVLLRRMPDSTYANKYRRVLIELRSALNSSHYGWALFQLGGDTLAINLPAPVYELWAKIRPSEDAAAPFGAGGVAQVVEALKHADPDLLRQALMAMSRTFDPQYGSLLNRLTAMAKKHGTDEQYREVIRGLHAPAAEKGIDDFDPVIAGAVEAEAQAARGGTASALTPEGQMAIFAGRALDVAFAMLRESEVELLKVLTRTEGAGGTAAELALDTGKIVKALNRYAMIEAKARGQKQYRVMDVTPFEKLRPALEQQARASGADASEEGLRRTYERNLYVTLHVHAATAETAVRKEIASAEETVRDNEKKLRERRTYIGKHPFGGGPAGEWARRDQLIRQRTRWWEAQQRAEKKRDFYKGVRDELEAALPLLGGLTDDQLTKLARLTDMATFEQMRNAALARVFGNIEEARRDLHTGEVKVWLLPKVIARTKLHFGIEEPPANPMQKAWNEHIEQAMKAARADRDRTGRFLEILDTAALIAALGAAVFTGGGSLALYLGVGSAGISLGRSIFDAADTHSRMAEAELLHGTGLTTATRLSDVPPDWGAFYMALLNVGINAVFAAIEIRTFSAAGKTLRGEQAAVEAEARELAKRLKARGAAAAEDDIFEALMQAARDEGRIVGATRGSVYTVTGRRELVGGAGGSLQSEITDRVIGAPRVHGATLAADPALAVAGDELGYALTVPVKGGGTQVVKVKVRARPTDQLPPGPHGADSGPARLTVSRDATGWQATIDIDQGLKRGELKFAAGHELDEIADLVHRRGASARPGDIAREVQAGYFQPGGTTRTTTGRAQPILAHDRAAAAELQALYDDLQRFKSPLDRLPREQRLERAMREMGLFDPTNLPDRVAALRKLGISEELIRRVEARALAASHLTTPALSAAGASGRLVTAMDADFMQHLLYMEARSPGEFLKMGNRGGHPTAALQSFEKANPQFAFVESKTAKSAGGTTFHHYDQYRWIGPGKPPTAPSLRPGGRKVNAGHWELSTQPKTTADDLGVMLREGEDAWGAWRQANLSKARTDRQFTHTSASGVEFTGFFDYIPATSTTPESWRLITLFVEARWF